MNRTELKAAKERYDLLSKRIKLATENSLFEETDAVREARIHHLLDPKHYGEFFEYYFGIGSQMALASSPSAPFHIRATQELIAHPIITQFRLWFRGSAKSVHTNIGNMFLLNQRGESQMSLIVGINELRACMLLADLQAHLKHNLRIIADFGRQVSYGDWSKGAFETKNGSYFMALGIDQPFRGLRHYGNRLHFVSIDDIEDRKVANNPRIVAERTDKILGDIAYAFSPDKRRMVICNNLISSHGIIARLRDKIGDKPTTKTSLVSILGRDGKPTWGERYSPEHIEQLRTNTDYYTWMREMMNTPIEEGKLFRNEWIHYAPTPPLQEMDALVIYGDLSYKEAGDFKAMMFLGKKERNFYLIDAFVQQCSRAVVAAWLYDLYETLHLQTLNVHYRIEGLFAQDEFTNDFDEEGDQRGYYIPVVADKSPKASKYERIESMVGFFERGNVFLPEDKKSSPHLKRFLEQLLAFEKGSTAHDDAPDAFQAALAELNRYTASGAERIHTPRIDRNQHHRF